MARRHWLDPLARRLLIASGQLPAALAKASGSVPPAFAQDRRPGASPAWPPPEPSDHHDAVERELLAMKLAHNPGLRLRDAEEVRHAAALGWRLDVNKATASDWSRLPGCSANRADLLARLRTSGVQLSGPDDLREVLGLDATTLACWLPLLEFRWYGDGQPVNTARVAVNQASLPELARLPGLTPERGQRLVRERGRGPFRDLADLGERLGLPPEVLESWIGRVSFTPGPAGPELPPARRIQGKGPAAGSPRPGGPPAR